MTDLPLVDRPLSDGEVGRLRLLLSTYQDGTGMVGEGTLPGWRDFERSVAQALGGIAKESKAIFDVILSSGAALRPDYGVSCKMRRELRRLNRDNRVTIEVSNAAGEFWAKLNDAGIMTEDDLVAKAHVAGKAISEVVDGWHEAVSVVNGGTIDLARSCYLVLLWSSQGNYQLFQFPLDIWDAQKLSWAVPDGARRLCGFDGHACLVEWYFASGGQLKAYPLASEALWRSERFRLEPLPTELPPASNKAAIYFGSKWEEVADT